MTSWEVPAKITKADITPLGALKGKVNSDEVALGSASYPPGRVVYGGFAGRLHRDDQLYHGVFRLSAPEPGRNYETFAFAEKLPGVGPVTNTAAPAPVVDAAVEDVEDEGATIGDESNGSIG